MDSFPAFIPLRGARVLIVGEGDAAEAKARLFESAPAELVRLDVETALTAGALEGARLVFVAVEDAVLARKIAMDARYAGALVNVVDKPALSDFVTPAIVDRGSIVAGVGTGGAAPVLATLLRGEIETRWPEGLGSLGSLSREIQDEVRAALPDLPARRAFWRRLMAGPAAQAAMAGDLDRARTLVREALDAPDQGSGRVMFLEAPSDPDRLTVAAVRALGAADRIVAGPEVAAALMAYARRDAARLDQADVSDMAAWAAGGETILRIGVSPLASEVEAVTAAGAAVQRLP